MAIAFNAATDGGDNGGSGSLTFSHPCSSGINRLLAVLVLGDTSVDDITGVTYSGVSMTLAAKLAPGGPDDRWTYLFFLVAPATGSNNVIISTSGTHYIAGGAADYTGVGQTGQPDATMTNTGSGSITSLATSITTIADNSWAILAECNGGGLPPTSNTGNIRRVFGATFANWGIFDSNGPITPPGSYLMVTNTGLPSNTILHVIASFSPPGAVPPVTLMGAMCL